MSAGIAAFTVQRRRCSRRRRPVQRPSQELHVVTFRMVPAGLHPQFATILVRGRCHAAVYCDIPNPALSKP